MSTSITTTGRSVEAPILKWHGPGGLRAQGWATMVSPTGDWYLRDQGDTWLNANRHPDTGELEIAIRQGGRSDRHWLVLLLGSELELLAQGHARWHEEARALCHAARNPNR